jgi:YgiT-type zinc finger domain-containing protein
MKCIYCDSEMVRGKPPFALEDKGVYLSLDNVPVWFCTPCEEIYVEEGEGYF